MALNEGKVSFVSVDHGTAVAGRVETQANPDTKLGDVFREILALTPPLEPSLLGFLFLRLLLSFGFLRIFFLGLRLLFLRRLRLLFLLRWVDLFRFLFCWELDKDVRGLEWIRGNPVGQ